MNSNDAGPYHVRRCHNHFHVCVDGHDLIGGRFSEEDEAHKAADRLNAGDEVDAVLGDPMDRIFGHMKRYVDEHTEQEG